VGALISKGNKDRAFVKFLKVRQALKEQERQEPTLIFLVAMMNVTPDIIFSSVKLGGASYGIPLPISESKRIVFSIK